MPARYRVPLSLYHIDGLSHAKVARTLGVPEPTVRSLVSRARREMDDAKRVQMYTQADSMAFEEAPMLFLYFKTEVLAVQSWIKGFKSPAILNGQPWTQVRIDTTTSRAR